MEELRNSLLFYCMIIFGGLLQAQSGGSLLYTLNHQIPFETYNGGEYIFGEITGMAHTSDSTIIWINKAGLIATYNWKKEQVLHSCSLDKIVSKAFFIEKESKVLVANLDTLAIYSFDNCNSRPELVINDSIPFSSNKIAINSSQNRIIAATQDSLILMWTKDSVDWKQDYIKVPFDAFTFTFYTDAILYVGDNKGSITIIDLTTKQILKQWKVFEATISEIAFSQDKQKIAVTNGAKVRIGKASLGAFRTLKTNIALINKLKWIDTNELLVAGTSDGMEFWNTSTRKLHYSYNADAKSKSKLDSKPPPATGHAFLYLLNEKFEEQYQLKQYAKVTALNISQTRKVAIGKENMDILSLSIEKRKLVRKNRLNITNQLAVGKGRIIEDIQIKNESIVYVGSTYGRATYNLQSKDSPFNLVEHWYSNNQIDILSFKDVDIVKRDNKFKNYKEAIIQFNVFKGIGKKKNSNLYKKVRKRSQYGNVGLEGLINPSGFHLSHKKRYLVAFDAAGIIRILDLENLDLVVKKTVSEYPIVYAFFDNNNNLLVLTEEEGILFYNFNGSELTKLASYQTDFPFSKATFNEKDLIALFDSTSIRIFDLTKKEIIKVLPNPKEDRFAIDLVKFIPYQKELLFVLNEKTPPRVDNEVIDYSISLRYTKELLLSSNKSTLWLANSNGDLLFYKR